VVSAGCWKCYLLQVKADINIAIQKVKENTLNFTAIVNNLLRMEPIQLPVFTCFGCAWLIVLTKISACGIFTIVSWYVASRKTSRKRKQAFLWVAFLSDHLPLPFQRFLYFFFGFVLFDDLKDTLGKTTL